MGVDGYPREAFSTEVGLQETLSKHQPFLPFAFINVPSKFSLTHFVKFFSGLTEG